MENNIVWHKMFVDRKMRENLIGQKGKLIWFTGLSGSGKSTVAALLEKELYSMGKLTYVLDGDNVRHGLNSDLGFSEGDRSENIRRISELCKLFVDCGVVVIATFVSPFKRDRNKVRNLILKDFIEVYVSCPVEVCKKRDPKGLYKKAVKGEIKEFTGISAVYELPENPEIVIDTNLNTADECVKKIVNYLQGVLL